MAPTRLSAYEVRTVLGYRGWTADALAASDESVFPPDLGERLPALLRDGTPQEPIDIGTAVR